MLLVSLAFYPGLPLRPRREWRPKDGEQFVSADHNAGLPDEQLGSRETRSGSKPAISHRTDLEGRSAPSAALIPSWTCFLASV